MLKKHSMTFLILPIAIMLLLISACENGIIGTGEKPAAIVGGYAQKGPFEIGSQVTIVSRPGPDYIANNISHVQTRDGIGSFEFSFVENTLYDISITGRDFNEVTGQLSIDPISLQSSYFHERDSTAFIGVNILTHQIHKRLNYLIANGLHPVAATTQASLELQRELGTTIFAKHLDKFNFNKMTVYNLKESDTTANAVLLFISAAFYQQSLLYDQSPALIDVIDYIATDLETDGIIEQANSPTTGEDLTSSLDYAARLLDPEKISDHLVKYGVATMGKTLSVPDINFLLDNDNDGLTNDIDNDDDGDGIADIIDSRPYQFDIHLSPLSFNTAQEKAIKLDLQLNLPKENAGNLIFIEIDTPPSNGSITSNYPNVIYTPDPDFNGADSFKYHVLYATTYATFINSNTTTITIEISPP